MSDNVMLDTGLLGTLSVKNRYKALIGAVPMEEMGTSTKWLLNAYGSFFNKNPDANSVDFDALRSMVRLKLQGDASSPALALIDEAEKIEANKETVEFITQTLYEMQLAGNAARLVNEFNDGAEIDLSYELYRQAMETRKLLGTSVGSMFKEPDIHEILEEAHNDDGLKFRQLCLQEHIKGLLPPLNIAFCAAVDSGKTSFLADALTYMAPECERRWPGRPIVWLSNEGVTREIWPRLYQSALGKNGEQLYEMSREQLFEEYGKALGGDRKKIKLLDIHGWSMAQIAGLVEELNPIILVIDMPANVKMPGFEKPHQKMEAVTQELRELAALHDFISIFTVQLSADAYDNLYPAGHQLKDVKIGLQGALDIQIMMGKLVDPTYQYTRGFSLPKNKRKKVGKPSNFRAEVIFNPDTARFSDN